MTKSTIVQILGELVGSKTYRVHLLMTVKELYANESAEPVARAIARMELVAGHGAEDGEYKLRYSFDGKCHEEAVRVKYGTLLAGPA